MWYIYIYVSIYPESFVQIEKVVRKKINIYYSEGVWNPLPQMNMKTCDELLSFSIYCQTLFWVLSAGVLCTLRVAGWKPTSNHIKITVGFFNLHKGWLTLPAQGTSS